MENIEKLRLIRERMRDLSVSAYIIPSSDPHISEYLPERYKCIEWVSGFTGSAGTLVITEDFAGLWTDSRYFVQANEQLSGTGFQLVPLKKQGSPEFVGWLNDQLSEGDLVAFDGKLASLSLAETLKEQLDPLGIRVDGSLDLLKGIWADRPLLPTSPAFLLNEEEVGQSANSKIEQIREEMRSKRADYHLISSLDDLAWVLNIRGRDVPCNPVVLGYLFISQEETQLYIDVAKLSEDDKLTLRGIGVSIRNYNSIYETLSRLSNCTVLLDPNRTCSAIYDSLGSSVIVVKEMNPSTLLKAVKNEVEIEHTRSAMIKDGVALTKFFKWLEESISSNELTETSIADRLQQFREEQDGFVDISFDTIAGYLEHGALPHYKATPESDSKLRAEGLLLIDSGGQYRDGTTDITRVISLGKIKDEERRDYTIVLKGMIEGSMSVFPKGTCGYQLDAITRRPIWETLRNYGHGTGHGVGFFLNVHEGPHVFNPSNVNIPIEKGMITSIEPGLYREGKYGIRIENLVLSKHLETNEFAEFYNFETLTLCYISTDLVDSKYLDQKHIDWLNRYNKRVFDKLSPYLTKNEREWLAQKTKNL